MLTSPASDGGDGNTILSTEDEYIKEMYIEMIDKGFYREASEDFTRGTASASSPSSFNVLDHSSRIFASYHGQLSKDYVHLPHNYKPPNGFGHWQLDGAASEKYRKIVEVTINQEGRKQVNSPGPSK
ncbi:unnamed protein product [Rhizoctonia solani]|uniref:Uncharacterized protein n=1 Tax=Rhizoctonia solani TaxID=456999 RepID=A0A8H3HK29_9AGAM|nr:unnamed protein product [Rhizoctonia solani]